jgi:S-adenosylmethionine/arginine decarboxylase-like enzyme
LATDEIKGLHIIGDFIECDNIIALTNHSFYLTDLNKVIMENKMTDLGEMVHYFGQPYASGYSINVMLSESHLTIHTFPLPGERNKATVDIYTCSVSQDNGLACKNVYNWMVALFKPKEIQNEYFIKRY